MQVKDILEKKGRLILSVQSDQTLYEVLEVLVGQNVGAALVLHDNGEIAGIVSERDMMRECYLNKEDYLNTPISLVMTRKVIVTNPEESLDKVMSLMTHNRIRHLPVMDNRVLMGMISIGDVVRAQLRDYKEESRLLKQYLYGEQAAS